MRANSANMLMVILYVYVHTSVISYTVARNEYNAL